MKNTSNKIVEIIGPAGAGKTTLYHALDRYTESIRLGNFPDVHNIADAPFFISNGIQLIPRLLPLYRPKSRQLTRREFAWMTILNGWSALLRKLTDDGNKVIVLDQGPVYLMAEMHLFGPEYIRQKIAESLWQDLYKCWSNTLYMVVWLDASNDVLLERIRNRCQEHIMKEQPTAAAYEFLNRYRTEYEFILSSFIANETDLKLLQFDTKRKQPGDIVNELLPELSC